MPFLLLLIAAIIAITIGHHLLWPIEGWLIEQIAHHRYGRAIGFIAIGIVVTIYTAIMILVRKAL